LRSVDDDGRPLAPFVGRADRVAFVAPPPLSASAAGLMRYELALVPGLRAGERDLVLTSAPFVPPTASRFRSPQIETTVLVEQASGLAIRYFGPMLAPATGADRWHVDWDRPTLPPLVEIVFGTGSSSASASGRYERQVVLVEVPVARTR